MRILTVRQPWAYAIIHGGKDVENRSRNIAGEYRGPVALHAGLAWDYAGGTRIWEINKIEIPPFETSGEWDIHGAIIGVVDLTGAHRAFGDNPGGFNLCGHNGQCSDWAESTGWHLTFARPRPLSEPIPYRGGQGLRKLPDDVAEIVNARAAS